MKSKVVNIVLSVVLIISIVGNIYIVKLTSDAKEDVTALRDRLAAADEQIVDLEGKLTNFARVQEHVADLQGQLTDFEKVQTEVADLQKQLTESKDLIESLESTVTENNITVANLEEQRANQEQLLLKARANANMTAQNGNGGGQSSSEEPPANPENTLTDNVSNQGDGRDNSINPGLVTEPNGDVHPQVGHRYDDNNPSLPIYEGPKEGYTWSNIAGYVPAYNGPVGQTGNDMAGDQSACVFDENGNCTVHQHSGY